MNPTIAERFKKKNEEWDFNTVIDGKAVASRDISAYREEAEKAQKEADEALANQEKENVEVVTEEQLALALGQEYGVVPSPEPEPEPEQPTGERSFDGLEDFNVWYAANREDFTENQRKALNLLLALQQSYMQSCKCDREKNKAQSQIFFQQFFTKNSHTDLIPAIKKIGKFEKISFFSFGGETPFLEA